MSLVVVAGGKGAPGATTTALGLASAWTGQQRVVVEGDPDGGVLAARLGLGYEPGLVTVAAARAESSARRICAGISSPWTRA